MLAIAFDPGLAKTGYCIAEDGKVVKLGIIKTSPKESLAVRLGAISYEIMDLMAWAYLEKNQAKYDVCLIEEFVDQHAAMLKRSGGKAIPSMIKCATARGVIFGTILQETKKIRFIGKGTIKKEETRLLAIDRGIIKPGAPKSIHDALDAYQLLVCAGICK